MNILDNHSRLNNHKIIHGINIYDKENKCSSYINEKKLIRIAKELIKEEKLYEAVEDNILNLTDIRIQSILNKYHKKGLNQGELTQLITKTI